MFTMPPLTLLLPRRYSMLLRHYFSCCFHYAAILRRLISLRHAITPIIAIRHCHFRHTYQVVLMATLLMLPPLLTLMPLSDYAAIRHASAITLMAAHTS